MPERIFKVKRIYLWAVVFYAVVILSPFLPSLWRPATLDSLMLPVLSILMLGAGTVFLSGMFFQDLILTESALRWVSVLTGKTTREMPLTGLLRVEVRQVGTNRQLCLTTRERKLSVIHNVYADFDELVKVLCEQTASDAEPVTPDLALVQDIGQRPVHLIGLAVGLFIVALAADKMLLKAWHTSSENMFSWMLIAAPVAIALCYGYIRGEKKAQPLAAAVITGVLLGAACCFDFLIANRLYTEASAVTGYAELRFLEQGQRRQKWEPVDPEMLVFHDGYFHVADVWADGYNPDLKAGEIYRIAVLKGSLNDIAFPVEGFRQAVRVEGRQ